MPVNPGQELSSINFRDMIGGPLRAVVEAQAAAALSTVNFIKEVGFEKSPAADGTVQETGRPVYVTFRYPKEVAPYQPAADEVPASLTVRVDNPGSGYPASPAPQVTVTPAPGDSGTGFTATATVVDGKVTKVDVAGTGKYRQPPTIEIAAPGGDGTAAKASVASFQPYEAATAAQPASFQEMKLEVPLLTIVPIPYLRVEETTIQFNAKINSMTYERTSTDAKVDAAISASAGWGWGRASLNVSASYQKKTESGEDVQRTYSLDIVVKAVQDELPGGMEKVLGVLEDAIRSQPSAAPERVSV
jgi:hypothetical protein